MPTLQPVTGITVKNILYLTDFSEPSQRVIPLVVGIARHYGAAVHALHVLVPNPYVYMTPDVIVAVNEAEEQTIQIRMQQTKSALRGCKFESTVEEALAIWPVVEEAVKDKKIDLIILGSHGRTGLPKLVLGSATEEIIRRADVPVLTIGPMAAMKKSTNVLFHCILCATDFKTAGWLAGSYANSLAQDNDAQLSLLHVIRHTARQKVEPAAENSVANALHKLHELVPRDGELFARTKVLVEHGDPAKKIVEVAGQRAADLIVMGAHRSPHLMQTALHFETSTVHDVIANAPCPVLTVRS